MKTTETLKKQTCYDCAYQCSSELDVVCHIWCSKTDRNFTFGGENDEACELFKKDF